MRDWRCGMVLAMAACLAGTPDAQAQQINPHIGYVYPAGARQGTAVDVTVGGQYLDGVDRVFVSGGGVKATVVEYVKPMTQQEFNKLRDRLQELQKKPEKDAATRKEIDELREKISTFVRRPASPAIVETVTLRMTIDSGADLGPREVRLGTAAGLTDPLTFCVGQLPEVAKKPAKAPRPTGQNPGAIFRNEPRATPPEPPIDITLPTMVNGQIMPGQVDRYRFFARKGERLVVAVSARELIPYLADAVPGWFQAAATLLDSKGNEVAFADHYSFHPDPVLRYVIPANAQYTLEIRDSIYRGREDFVYRIALGELPFVTGIFPLGGKAGTKLNFELTGWNLPQEKLTLDTKDKPPGVYPLFVVKDQHASNRLPFALDTLPERLEEEPNNTPEQAQRVTLPTIINGRIDQPGKWDVFRFEGHSGDKIVADVMAPRLDSPLDSVLKLTDADGKQLAINDDREDKGMGLETHHADSYLAATLPSNGTYYVYIGDAQHKAGSDYAYRLRISPPLPDFELRIVPSSVNVRGMASTPMTVYALRKDGFSGEISLRLKDAPERFTLGGGRVPAGQDLVRFTLAPPLVALKEPVDLKMEGRATIEGKEIVHQAVPAEDMMQAFAYRHLVPAQELKVAAWSRRFLPKMPVRMISKDPVKIPAGGTARVQVGLPFMMTSERMHLELDEPPEGITIQKVAPGRGGTEIVLESDAAKVKPGQAGNLIVNAFPTDGAGGGKGKGKGQGNRPRMPVGTLPAIPFEVVAPP